MLFIINSIKHLNGSLEKLILTIEDFMYITNAPKPAHLSITNNRDDSGRVKQALHQGKQNPKGSTLHITTMFTHKDLDSHTTRALIRKMKNESNLVP